MGGICLCSLSHSQRFSGYHQKTGTIGKSVTFIQPQCCLATLGSKYLQSFIEICNALRGLVPLAQFKKREKNPWRSVILVKLQG